ncbi:MAG: right-handed parallel beta-helix repeat-containing protein, partial [Deferrisomatales bacterium]
TLAAAEAASIAGDTLFVLNGDATAAGQNAGVLLKANQRLIGQGVAFVFPGFSVNAGQPGFPAAPSPKAIQTINAGILQGTPIVPTVPLVRPRLANPGAAQVVLLASGNEVAGLALDAAGVTGAAVRALPPPAAPVVDFTIRNNAITGSAGKGIWLQEVASSALPAPAVGVRANPITTNTVSGSAQEGILIESGVTNPSAGTVLTATLSGNTVTGNGRDGIAVVVQGDAADVNATVADNVVDGNATADATLGAITLRAGTNAGTDAPGLTALVSGNRVGPAGGTGNAGIGIDLDSRGSAVVTAQVVGNTVAGNGDTGIAVDSGDASTLTVTVIGNTNVSGNGTQGIDVAAEGTSVARVDVLDNIVTGSGLPPEVQAVTRNGTPSLCLTLEGNQVVADLVGLTPVAPANGFLLTNLAGTFNVARLDFATRNEPNIPAGNRVGGIVALEACP